MNRKFIFSRLAVGALALSGLAATLPGASASPAHAASGTSAVHVCGTHPAPGRVACLAMAVTDANGTIITDAASLLVGFNAADIQGAYNLKGLQSNGRTVAIVDAFGYPTLASDLNKFRQNNGLPPCTKSNGCLKVMGQDGGKPPSGSDSGWDLEQALDLDMVSAACPDCKIVMVESNNNTFGSIEKAVNTAARQRGVVAISNSYGGGDGGNRPAYNHPGIAITASTGDSGFQGGLYPASDTHVIAVGGTSVFKDTSNRGFHERAWGGAGSGCSSRNKAPDYQQGVRTTCGSRDAAADVSGAADPSNGGLRVVYNGNTVQVGGTSESAPLIAAVYALSGRTSGYPGKFPYANRNKLYDVKAGSNGSCGSPLCSAGQGWDGPTGLGTPNGVAGF